MNTEKFELDELLKAAVVPERSAGYWERFPQRVTTRLKEGVVVPLTIDHQPSTFSRWSFVLAAACLLIGFATGYWMAHPHGTHGASSEAGQVAQNEKLFREMASLFPNQIRAIISDNQGVRLVLSEKAEIPTSTPLLLKICDGGQCRRIITFSGQQIRVNGENCEVLSDSRGNVMVVGRRWYWSSADPSTKASRDGRSHIQAQPLEISL
ncbi:MAG: hypothetical protein HY360_00625 [Verrucomicrobia bacterium]|nr:hypothetical protein [Verrucomicrobiota bacterium]